MLPVNRTRQEAGDRARKGGRVCVSAVSFVALMLLASNARAELVFFGTGRSLSVKGHRAEGSSLVLVLRSGGEIVCDPSLIARIEPDEVPYPEPPTEDARATGVAADAGELAVAGRFRLLPELAQYIDKVAAEQNVPAKLVKAVIQVESANQERARSPKGAMGLMQLMPETAKRYAVGNPYDPRANIEAGIKHLKTLLQRFPLTLALAAYNAGEAAVQRYGGVPPYRETQNYVARIVELFGRRSL